MPHRKPLLYDAQERILDTLFLSTLQKLKIFSNKDFHIMVAYYHKNYIQREEYEELQTQHITGFVLRQETVVK